MPHIIEAARLSAVEICVLQRLAMGNDIDEIAQMHRMTSEHVSRVLRRLFPRLKLSPDISMRKGVARAAELYVEYGELLGFTTRKIRRSPREISMNGHDYAAIAARFEGLAPELLETAGLIADGLNNEQIAKMQGLDRDTSGRLIGRLYKEMGFDRALGYDRRTIVIRAFEVRRNSDHAKLFDREDDGEDRSYSEETVKSVAKGLDTLSPAARKVLDALVGLNFVCEPVAELAKKLEVRESTANGYVGKLVSELSMPFIGAQARMQLLREGYELRLKSGPLKNPESRQRRFAAVAGTGAHIAGSEASRQPAVPPIDERAERIGRLEKDDRKIVFEVFYAKGDMGEAAKNLGFTPSVLEMQLDIIYGLIGIDEIEPGARVSSLIESIKAYREAAASASSHSAPKKPARAAPSAPRRKVVAAPAPAPAPRTNGFGHPDITVLLNGTKHLELAELGLMPAVVRVLPNRHAITDAYLTSAVMTEPDKPPPELAQRIAQMRARGFEPEVAVAVSSPDGKTNVMQLLFTKRGG